VAAAGKPVKTFRHNGRIAAAQWPADAAAEMEHAAARGGMFWRRMRLSLRDREAGAKEPNRRGIS